MEKINLKQLLAATAGLTIIAPTTVGVLANINDTIDTKISNQQIVDNINQKQYQLVTPINSKTSDLITMIDSQYIKKQLSDEIQNVFDGNLFKFNQITVNNNILNDYDLTNIRHIEAEINYDYDSIKNQKTKLIIETMATEAQIVSEINNINYQLENVPLNSSIFNLTKKVNSNLIASELSDDIKQYFTLSWFKLNSIKVQDQETERDLNNDDLTKVKTIETNINYDYGSIKNQTTSLTINVAVVESQIIEAINNTNYEISIDQYSTVKELEPQITGEFIQDQLTTEAKNAINPELFSLIKITLNQNKLQDDDFNQLGSITTEIEYNYSHTHNETTNLTIKINPLPVSDEEMIQAINSIDYEIATIPEEQAKNITNQIDSEFILNQLTNESKEYFRSRVFKFNQITFDGHTLNDDDLLDENTITTKINYDYGSIKNTEATLIIKIASPIADEEISTAISKAKYEITIIAGDTAQSLFDKIDGDFISAQLKDDAKTYFRSRLFKLEQITTNGKEIIDDDLANPKLVMLAKINYSYGATETKEVNLMIAIKAN